MGAPGVKTGHDMAIGIQPNGQLDLIAVVCGVLIVLILLNFIPDILEEDKKKISDTEIVDGARDYRLMNTIPYRSSPD